MSGKTNYRSVAVNLRKDVEALRRQLENERAASHLLRMDANLEKERRTIAENENFTLKRSLALYANAEGGRADVARLLPTLQIDRSGHIA